MSDHRKTNLINKTEPITSEMAALYEMLRSSVDLEIRKSAARHLLQWIENGEEVDRETISDLFRSERNVGVAAELKRALNKLKIRETLQQDPTSKYDKKLTCEEERSILGEIERLRKLYDQSSREQGSFQKKYRVIEILADGGMGRIFKAIRLTDQQIVAIKFLLIQELAEHNDPERMIARFKREGEILRRLSHPNIIKGFEYGEADGEYFLVMEYVDGETLEDRLKSGPLDFQTFKTMALQVCDAVECSHKNQIIHRDIKPGNIFMQKADDGTRIKLFDFGLAKDKRDKSLSRFAFSGGTDDYISPQQDRDARDADERDDIYSLGKSFYQMLVGKVLRQGDPYVEVSLEDKDISYRINQILKKCVSPQRKDRWQTVQELKSALETLQLPSA